jgi:hypothetical protein
MIETGYNGFLAPNLPLLIPAFEEEKSSIQIKSKKSGIKKYLTR